MDPNVKPGSNWPKLSPHEQLAILRRYRDNLRKRDDAFLVADDFFIGAILAEGLTQEYINEMDKFNLV